MAKVLGILAHVDSGKTTLSEAILYLTGEIRTLGRVDHRDAFLDTDSIERERGITIFSKQANFNINNTPFTLLDTPGHVDFSAEAERVLRVLDCAVLVISGVDKVQSHTETIWQLLKRYKIPTFIFVNKMDLALSSKEEIMSVLQKNLDGGCVDFDESSPDFLENVALCDDALMNSLLESGSLSKDEISGAIARRNVFPCLFGSALKLDGVDSLLSALSDYSPTPSYGDEFSAKVFKITEDDRGNRLTHIKLTGGVLKARDIIGEEKVNEIRIYSGEKYKSAGVAYAGDVCAVTGLSKTYPGQGLGREKDSEYLSSSPIFSYSVLLPDGVDALKAYHTIKKLEDEETELNISYNDRTGEIEVRLMGEVQLEVLKDIISSRFNIDVNFTRGSVIYKETISNTVEGVGHYEPLRHYAEVHLKMEPALRGEGMVFASECSDEVLEKNFQRLVLTHLAEKTHLGVLTGSPVTDIKITLVSGKAHLKHTEGGDFRQATYRAVRQGLMKAESVLLEPWYSFTMTLPSSAVGRAMTDIDRMCGKIEPPELIDENTSLIRGSAPISQMHGYDRELTAYTKGLGKLSCSFMGYDESPNMEEAVAKAAYDPESDIANSPDSVFCSQGAGFVVKWYDVEKYMHLSYEKTPERASSVSVRGGSVQAVDEDELIKIFESVYGKIRRKTYTPMKTQKQLPEKQYKSRPVPDGPEYLLIDGYNIIFAWDDLKEAAEHSLEASRQKLIERVSAYYAIRRLEIIIVFDAYKVKGNHGSVEKIGGITVVYTKEAETADSYIERTSHNLSKNHRVRVATSDNLEQMIILGSGALRISAAEFLSEVENAEKEIDSFIQSHNLQNRNLDNKVLTEAILRKLED
jgi:small GTP-binding protein